jgi:hypothetical protein
VAPRGARLAERFTVDATDVRASATAAHHRAHLTTGRTACARSSSTRWRSCRRWGTTGSVWSDTTAGPAARTARHPEPSGRSLSPAPDDEVRWIPDEQRATLAVMRAGPPAGRPQLEAVFATLAEQPDAAVASVATGPADDTVVAVPAHRARPVAMLDEAFRQGAFGSAPDIVSYGVVPWGFEPGAVKAPVTLFQVTPTQSPHPPTDARGRTCCPTATLRSGRDPATCYPSRPGPTSSVLRPVSTAGRVVSAR